MSFLDKLKEYAPSIASAIFTGGATLPALAMKAVSDAMGVDEIKSAPALAEAVANATPEQLLAVKQADNQFAIRMKELGNELTATELADVQDARKNHKDSIMPAALVIFLTLMVALTVAALFYVTIPDKNSSTLYFLLGNIVTAWLSSIAYWVGTTRSSAAKTDMMAKIKTA